jgi:hypothetical protein
MPENTTAIVKVEEYKIMKMDAGRRAEIIKENLGALGVSQFDLDRAKIPAGGITKFEVPTLDGSDFVGSIRGIIIGYKDGRVYWETPYEDSGGGSPPDCVSEDCEHGSGTPGGLCAKCPLAQFGSARKGDGQACQQRRLLFIARPKSNLPLIVSLPPTSLAPARKFFLRLVDAEVPFYGVVVEIGLEKDSNAAGVDYAKANFRVVEHLSPEMLAKAKAIRDEFAQYIQRAPVADPVEAVEAEAAEASPTA